MVTVRSEFGRRRVRRIWSRCLGGRSGRSGARNITSASATAAIKQKKVDSYPAINVNYAQLSSIEVVVTMMAMVGFGGSAIFSVGYSGQAL